MSYAKQHLAFSDWPADTMKNIGERLHLQSDPELLPLQQQLPNLFDVRDTSFHHICFLGVAHLHGALHAHTSSAKSRNKQSGQVWPDSPQTVMISPLSTSHPEATQAYTNTQKYTQLRYENCSIHD